MSKLVVAVLITALVSPSTSLAGDFSKSFCTDIAGTAFILGSVRDKGVTFEEARLSLQKYLADHSDFPASPPEKAYAFEIVEEVFKHPNLKGEPLGNFVYNKCMSKVDI